MNSFKQVEPGSLIVLVDGPIYSRPVECEVCDCNIEIEFSVEYNEHSEGTHEVIIDRECPICHCDILAVSSR